MAPERERQRRYWEQHARTSNVTTALLHSDAETLDRVDRAILFGLVGDLDGLDVLELGAGAGRLTGAIADRSRSVLAVDFVAPLVDQNRLAHAARPNVSHRCADVVELKLPPAEYDLVFTNWLLMYLSDHEVHELREKLHGWLRPDGKVLIRESCFAPGGNITLEENPTRYREPAFYEETFVGRGFELAHTERLEIDGFAKDSEQRAWLFARSG